jgi:hypothetical protein
MGKTRAAVKNKWNRENYDRIEIFVPKGKKVQIKAQAESLGKSTNAYIVDLIEEDMKKEP